MSTKGCKHLPEAVQAVIRSRELVAEMTGKINAKPLPGVDPYKTAIALQIAQHGLKENLAEIFPLKLVENE